MNAFLEHRDDLGAWLNEQGLIGVGAEIGVAFGGFSRIILEKWHGRVLHLVDLWEKQPDEDYRERTNADDPFEQWFKQVSELAREYKRVNLHVGHSHKMAEKFSDGFLDFVYIDANHGYEWVRKDLAAWWPKVKSGGVMLGHDFMNDVTPPNFCEVQRAVEDWAIDTITPIHLTRDAVQTWYCFKG